MTLLLCFATVLLAAVLISSLAHRSVMSTAALFLGAGFLLGEGMLGVLPLSPQDNIVKDLANLALFAVLFSDGMRVGWQDLKDAMNLPGRALVFGLPLTLVITAAAAHYLVGLDWWAALLVGAVLAATDPVFAGALVGNDKVPYRLRHLLNVESGVNDGLALPFVMVFLTLAAGTKDLHLTQVVTELVLGVAVGITIPYIAIRLERLRWFEASTAYEPINAIAIGMLVFGTAHALHANLYLAAFGAGITVATMGERQKHAFEPHGELFAELAKLAALLVFGALITPTLLGGISWQGWVFAAVALLVARPVALTASFIGSPLTMREQIAASWFGPKGFASVVYGLIVLESGIPVAEEVFALVALTIVASILAHSSTDVLVAKWFDEEHEAPNWWGPVRTVAAHRPLRRNRT